MIGSDSQFEGEGEGFIQIFMFFVVCGKIGKDDEECDEQFYIEFLFIGYFWVESCGGFVLGGGGEIFKDFGFDQCFDYLCYDVQDSLC